MKIKVVIPNSGMSRGTLNARELMLSHAVSPAVIISVDCIPSGPRAIESNTDEVLAGSMLIDAAVQAERDGYDAFVVYCFSDLAVDAITLYQSTWFRAYDKDLDGVLCSATGYANFCDMYWK